MAEVKEIIDLYLVKAGKPDCKEDDNYLSYIYEDPLTKNFDFKKYYWLTPKAKYDIVKMYQINVRTAQKLADKKARDEYLDAKLAYINGKLEEEHEFLMSIKDKTLSEFIIRSQFQNKFRQIEMGPRVDNYRGDVENEKIMLEENKRLEKEHYKEYLKTNSKHIIISLVASLLLYVMFSDKINIAFYIPCAFAIGYSLYERVKINSFLRKGNKVQWTYPVIHYFSQL